MKSASGRGKGEGLSGQNEHFWGIVLAGGEGQRLQRFIRSRYRSDRPKQYCAFTGTRSMLRHTIDRAERVVAPHRLLIVVNHPHLPYAQEELGDRPSETVIIQPCNRETVAGILLPLLHVHHRDPGAVVCIFPSDHFVIEEDRFLDYVKSAALVAGCRGLHVLLGADSDRPEAGYGWIEVGEKIGMQGSEELYQVRRFLEKPNGYVAEALYVMRCLWNTLVLVGRADTLLELFQELAPEVFGPFQRIRAALGSALEEEAAREVYAKLPTLNFSRAVLERSPQHLGVLRMKGVYWSDWGEEERIQSDLARFRLRPRE